MSEFENNGVVRLCGKQRVVNFITGVHVILSHGQAVM